jgi:hypothetical protein
MTTTGTAASPQDRQGFAGDVKDAAMDAADKVKAEAASFVDKAQEQISAKAQEKGEAVSEGLHAFANAVRTAGQELDRQDQSMAGKLVRQAADGLEGLSRSMAGKRPEDLLETARRFGRDNPAALAIGAALVGLALGRLARTSAEAASDGPGATATRTADTAARPGFSTTTPAADVAAEVGSAIGLPDEGGLGLQGDA